MNDVEEKIESVLSAWKLHLSQNEKRWEPQAVYASMYRECERAMCYDLLAWQERDPFQVDTLEKMERGKEREKAIIARLIQVGQLAQPPFSVIHEQMSANLKNRQGQIVMRMRIDGRFKFSDGSTPPFEIKSLNPNVSEQIETIQDFDKYWWTKKMRYQLLMYLLAYEEPVGFFIMERNGIPRIIPMIFEHYLKEAEEFLGMAEKAMEAKKAVANGSETSLVLPPYHNDQSVCRRCDWFGKVCNPPLDFGQGALIITDAELEEILKKRNELASGFYDYQRLDKKVKDRFKEIPLAIVGDFQITGEKKHKKAYEVPESDYWQIKVEKLK